MYRKLTAAMLAAVFAVGTLASAASAASETRARAVVAEAKGKIEANDKAGVQGSAADSQTRARDALARAEKAIRDDKENRALHEAKADALAGLAQATSELNRLTAERDQLAAR